jgi:predicted nucleic acid-binding protein
MRYILDTNIISEIRKPKCDINVKNWWLDNELSDMYLSVITVGELVFGKDKTKDLEFQIILQNWLDGILNDVFFERIIDFDKSISIKWGEICAKNEKNGRSLPVPDSLIAATALANDFVLVTRNAKDFEGIEGLRVVNPWGD